MANEFLYLVRDVGFPMAIAIILIWDKMKTNNMLLKVVTNNTSILERLEIFLKGGK